MVWSALAGGDKAFTAFGDPSFRFTTGANSFTLQNLACHSRFRRESDPVYSSAVSDRSISAHPATADEVEPWHP
jgi:hypothetical protein